MFSFNWRFYIFLLFSPGSLIVTFDLGTEGNYDQGRIYNVLNNAVKSGSIPPYKVSPLSFSFRPLQGEFRNPLETAWTGNF